VSELDLPSHASTAFTATSRLDGAAVHLELTGNADTQATEPLNDLLSKLHDEVVRVGIKSVVVDMRALEFMNSSCLKAFVTWVSILQDSAASQQYKVTLRSNPELRWQRRSLNALARIATALVTVEA
jgi:anti-anti-sigma factor